jgi:hypothetical protein
LTHLAVATTDYEIYLDTKWTVREELGEEAWLETRDER